MKYCTNGSKMVHPTDGWKNGNYRMALEKKEVKPVKYREKQ